ncbi:MAG: hypothetical protein QNJ58_10625, partial [Desulfobacterales bacterium]|nr:hypothetical protein [Desulfobacterales bacterium]
MPMKDGSATDLKFLMRGAILQSHLFWMVLSIPSIMIAIWRLLSRFARPIASGSMARRGGYFRVIYSQPNG